MKAIRISELKYQKLSDKAIVQRILSGDKELYEILMRRNNQKLYRVLRGYIRNQEEIEDVMQETYLSAFTKLWQFKNDAQFSTWLIRIAINNALVLIKSKSKLRINENQFDDEFNSIAKNSNRDRPDHKLIEKEAKEMLERAIDELKEKYRVVYIMYELEGIPVTEIADCLEISVSNVKVRHHRAKAMIKENLYMLSAKTNLFEFGSYRCDNLVDLVMGKI